jgi:hypothetical protein
MPRKTGEKQTDKRELRGLSRREFARRAAGAAVAAAGISAAPLAAFGSAAAPAQQSPSPAEKLSAAGLEEVGAKTDYALTTYGSRLSDAQKTDLRRLIKESVEPLVELRKYALANGVQPATVLRLYPEPQSKSHANSRPLKKGGQ